MIINLTSEFQEVTTTRGTYQSSQDYSIMEIVFGDTPVKGEGILVIGTEPRNMDSEGQKVWARSLTGNFQLRVVLGFL
ncbi:MAG: hypothetical protein ACRC6B_10185 [Fusobacteriaceae bacterium]